MFYYTYFFQVSKPLVSLFEDVKYQQTEMSVQIEQQHELLFLRVRSTSIFTSDLSVTV